MTAAERGDQVLAAAVSAFAENGYAATTTDEVARRSGVSQPYVIRLFGNKRRLFLAAVNRSFDRLEDLLTIAARTADHAADPGELLRIIGHRYDIFLAERDMLLVLLHSFAASSDPLIGDEVRERLGGIYRLVRELTGASARDTRRFMATGQLLMVMVATRVAGPEAIPASWAREILDDLDTSGA